MKTPRARSGSLRDCSKKNLPHDTTTPLPEFSLLTPDRQVSRKMTSWHELLAL